MDGSGGSDTTLEDFADHFDNTSSVVRTHSSRYARNQRPKHHQRHSSVGLSTETLPSLPEYERNPPAHSVQSIALSPSTIQKDPSLLWDDKLQPPPNYPGNASSIPTQETAIEPEQVHTGREESPIRRRTSRPGHQRRRPRSYSGSGSGSDDALDLLLKRSVAALEASNALLQASLSTNTNLSSLLADSTFDRSIDSQLKFLERRLNASESQEEGMEAILQMLSSEGSSLRDHDSNHQNYGISRSLPVGGGSMREHMESPPIGRRSRMGRHSNSHQRRLRLSTEGRPLSPPPRPITQYIDSYASESTSKDGDLSNASIIIPSTLGIRSAPRVCHIPTTGPSPLPSPPAVPVSPRSQPNATSQPTTPIRSTPAPSAFKLLSSIHSRSSSITDRTTSHSRSSSLVGALSSPLSPTPHRREPTEACRAGLPARTMESPQIRVHGVTPPSPLAKTWTSPQPQSSRSQASDHSVSFDLDYNGSPVDLTSPPPSSTMMPFPNPATIKTVETLRKILADHAPSLSDSPSAVALGKQRADDERPALRKSTSMNFKAPSLLPVTKPSLSPAVAYHDQPPSRSPELTLPEPIMTTLSDTSSASSSKFLVVRRSALKTSSGRTSPASSGRSTPRAVSFASLPPKHQPNGTRRRPIKRERTRKPRVVEKQPEVGWLTQWLLGPLLVEESPGRRQNPSPIRRGAVVREEGNFGRAWSGHGGLESWQV